MGYTQYQDYRRREMRITVAQDLSKMLGYDFNTVLKLLEFHKVFGNWSLWELNHRPVNIEELAELVAEEVE